MLNWTASPSSGVTGYNVYRSTASGTGYTKINSSLVSGLTYTDATVIDGVTYYYVTTSVDSSGDESSYSEQVTDDCPMTYFKIVMQGQSETDVQLRLEHQSESFIGRVVGSVCATTRIAREARRDTSHRA